MKPYEVYHEYDIPFGPGRYLDSQRRGYVELIRGTCEDTNKITKDYVWDAVINIIKKNGGHFLDNAGQSLDFDKDKALILERAGASIRHGRKKYQTPTPKKRKKTENAPAQEQDIGNRALRDLTTTKYDPNSESNDPHKRVEENANRPPATSTNILNRDGQQRQQPQPLREQIGNRSPTRPTNNLGQLLFPPLNPTRRLRQIYPMPPPTRSTNDNVGRQQSQSPHQQQLQLKIAIQPLKKATDYSAGQKGDKPLISTNGINACRQQEQNITDSGQLHQQPAMTGTNNSGNGQHHQHITIQPYLGQERQEQRQDINGPIRHYTSGESTIATGGAPEKIQDNNTDAVSNLGQQSQKDSESQVKQEQELSNAGQHPQQNTSNQSLVARAHIIHQHMTIKPPTGGQQQQQQQQQQEQQTNGPIRLEKAGHSTIAPRDISEGAQGNDPDAVTNLAQQAQQTSEDQVLKEKQIEKLRQTVKRKGKLLKDALQLYESYNRTGIATEESLQSKRRHIEKIYNSLTADETKLLALW